jgi:2,4-dienoyl-CoA reductase-like NADH-dependent reductase (Old Yellow Enzyme family)
MPHLFSPLSLRGVTMRNRIGVSPMCQYSYQDGLSNDWQVIHLGARATGGAGLIIAEATAVEARGRITPFDVGLWNDAQIEPLKRVTEVIRANGAVAGIQLAHAGRKAGTGRPWDGGKPLALDAGGWLPVGASPIPFAEGYQTPHELTLAEIGDIVELFRSAAQRALAAGFELAEIHAAHGYLLHSFYSPVSNKRTDAYGGSFENRTRLVLEVTRAVRSVWPERLPVAVRISGTDWVDAGWSVEESVRLARQLAGEGVDLIDCSSGGNVSDASIPAGPGYQVPISEAVRKAGAATASVGLILAPAQADEIIRNLRADVVLLGREMLRDPYWALHAAQILHKDGPIPAQYLRAF